MNNEKDLSLSDIIEKIIDLLPDVNEMELWKLIAITLLLPPIGAFAFVIRKDLPQWIKIAAVIYAAAVTVFLLARESACAPNPIISASDIMISSR